jgi:hypothetical protein
MKTTKLLALFSALALATGCASTTLDVNARGVRSEAEELLWRAATRDEVVGHWRLRSVQGPAAAVLMDIAYWLDTEGSFTGAALFVGPPPGYEVLAGAWSLDGDGKLVLGEDAEPATAEIGGEWLKLAGADGSLVLERAAIQ